ncbi:hypothetical protein LCGC14_1535330 [marine sediment metagenome]|uniref:RNA ligase domain-containing protein n=1 Tax=marine sediment metagenome TaxID=412755 RepID=A0A0F9JFJ0_9ZZZZ
MRKLASIQLIKDVRPIENADSIEAIQVLGWQCVAKKGEFQLGDYCVYIEIDSVLPEDNIYFSFLAAKKYRIKTIKLRGQISQGIAFPISILPSSTEIIEGLEVTDILNIKKYEPQVPIHLSGIAKGSFPSFIPRTDETRIQSVPEVLTRHQGTPCVVTEKLDGTSITIYYNNGEFGVCSRNLEWKEESNNLYWQVTKKHDLENILLGINRNIAIQGEVIGPSLQKNRYALSEHTIKVFDIFDIDKYQYINRHFLKEWALILSIDVVPVLSTYNINDDLDYLVDMSMGTSILNPKVQREGIVIRPFIECQDEELGRLSFKVINPNYLLKYE